MQSKMERTSEWEKKKLRGGPMVTNRTRTVINTNVGIFIYFFFNFILFIPALIDVSQVELTHDLIPPPRPPPQSPPIHIYMHTYM